MMRAGLWLLLTAAILISMKSNAYAGRTPVGRAASQSGKMVKDRPEIIYVGDSRTMFMTMYGSLKKTEIGDSFCWVNGGGIGSISPRGNLTPLVRKMLKAHPDAAVVFNFGFNGNGKPKKNAGAIIRTYRRWMKQYPDRHFFVMNIWPSARPSGPYSNANVQVLNAQLAKQYQAAGIYIDAYTYLLDRQIVSEKTGAGMWDGMHYKSGPTGKILRFSRKFVEKTLATASPAEA